MSNERIIESDGQLIYINDETNECRLVEVSEKESANLSFSKAKARPGSWGKNQVSLLITLCKAVKDKLNDTRFKKIDIFKDIASEMEKQGHAFSASQCETKYNLLIKTYKDIVERQKWEYFDLMKNYLEDQPSAIKPNVANINLRENSLKRPLGVDGDFSTPACSSSTSNSSTPQKKKPCRPSQGSDILEILTWLEEREDQRMQQFEEHHRQNKEVLEKLVNALNKKN